jgi:hypothetical protein
MTQIQSQLNTQTYTNMILLRYKMIIYLKENNQKIFKFLPLKSLNKLHFVYFPMSSIKPIFGTMKYYDNVQQNRSNTTEKLSSIFKTNLDIAKYLFNTDLVNSKHQFYAFSTDGYSSGSKYYEATYINKSGRQRKIELDSKWSELTIINTELSKNNSSGFATL